MTYQGTVKSGKLELERPLSLPDGTVVQVEITPAAHEEGKPAITHESTTDEFWTDWDKLAQEVAEASKGKRSILDELSEMRR